MLGRYSFIVVVFNASPQEVSFVSPSLQSRNLQLHPIQVQSIASSIARILSISNFKRGVQFHGVYVLQEISSDDLVKRSKYEASSGRFVVPRRTTAVFVEPRKSKI
jgi:hypothetical protein